MALQYFSARTVQVMDSTDDVDNIQGGNEPPVRQWHWHRLLHLVVSPLLAIAVFSIGIPNYLQGWNEKTASITAERHLSDLSAQHLHRVDTRINALHIPNAINRALLSSGRQVAQLPPESYAKLHKSHFEQNAGLMAQAIVSFTDNLLSEENEPELVVDVLLEYRDDNKFGIADIANNNWFQAIPYNLTGRDQAQISDIHTVPWPEDQNGTRVILVTEKISQPDANPRTDRTYSVSLINIDALLKNSMSNNRLGGAVDHRIYFLEDGQKQLVHQSNPAFTKFANREPLTRRNEIESGGKQWLLEVSADKRSLAQNRHSIDHAIFASRIIGLLIAALILYLRLIEDKKNQAALQSTQALRGKNKKLHQMKKRIDLAVSASRDGIWDWNLKKNRVYCNQRLFEILGITIETNSKIESGSDSSFYETKRGWSFMMHMISQDDLIALQQDYKSLSNTVEKSAYHRKMCLKHNNGHNIWAVINAIIIRDPVTQEIERMVGTLSDVTLTQYVENNLKQEKELLKVTIDAVNEAIIMINKNGIVKHANQNACQILNISERYFVKTPVYENLNLFDPNISANIELLIRQCMEADHEISLSEKSYVQVDNTRLLIRGTISPVHDASGDVIGCVVNFSDVTRERRLAEKLSYQATHDSLTNLINRREFEYRLQQLIDNSSSDSDEHILCYLDLDQFKIVNDTCGHAAGDELLIQISQTLKEHIRRGDDLARLGGDEFGIILKHCNPETGKKIIENIVSVLDEFVFSWEGNIFRTGVSAGLTCIDKRDDLKTLLSAADAACFAAKQNGRNGWHFHDSEDIDTHTTQQEMALTTHIQNALQNDSFILRYQSIVHTTLNTAHNELLVSMVDHDGELMPPGAFIPAAERYNLMATLDRWVVKHALETLEKNVQLMKSATGWCINLSGQSIGDSRFQSFMLNILDNFNGDLSNIIFEITETAAVANYTKALDFITALRDRGCRLALDDFGSGMCSFSYLKSLPVDYLKIDGRFIRELRNSPTDLAIVRSINEVGHEMGMKTVAEFVPDETTAAILTDMGLDYLQGYGIAKPQLLSTLQEDLARRFA